MDPANSLHLRTAPSENGPKPVENSNDNLLDMVCESPLAGKVKFMCSFGGKILPRPSDGKLRYVGGETRLISINRNFSWKELMQKTLTIYSQPHIIKYQLPDEDLDALISLSCDEDYQNMMEEYDSLEKANGSVRLRIFLVSLTESEDPSLDSKSLESEPEYNFVVAVNNLAKLDRSISGNNLMSQSNHQLDSSPALYRDSLLCQTNTETGSQDPVGAAHNESSQFFPAPYTQQMVAESSTTSSPSLGIPSSSSVVPRIVVAAEERQEVIMSSLKNDDTMSNGPEFANEDHDDGAVDGAVSDAAVAELEASMYGLQQHVIDIDNQIIKNGDLEELRELGSGTFGTVYYGKWRGTDVAIKRIKKSCFAGRLSEQEKLTSDFWREAQILSKLHHPNVVAFYGVVPDGTGGTLATVTEFMVNGSLRNVLLRKDRMLDRRRKLTIAMDAAFGMEYLHSRSIVHFDLKCDNLLVNLRDPQRPICKVGDFGLSRIKRNTLVSGGVRGTLPWMAPELLNGSSSKVSEKVDVFSFGIVLWEILTGEEPYANMHCGAIIGMSLPHISCGIVNNTLRPPIPENCDPDWRKLMEQCWSANPDARPSFTEVTDRLRAMPPVLQSKGQAPGNR
nr:unnamed protein product [Digitaria exilis]